MDAQRTGPDAPAGHALQAEGGRPLIPGIVLTGTRGAGKSAVARELDMVRTGVHLRSVTTRRPRGDDAGHYDYVTAAAFDEEAEAGCFLVVARYGGQGYAVRVDDAVRAAAAGVPPILTLTPAATPVFLGSDARRGWAGVFLDAPDAVLDARLAARGTVADPETRAQRTVDRSGFAGALPVVVNDRSLDEAVAAVMALLGLPALGG